MFHSFHYNFRSISKHIIERRSKEERECVVIQVKLTKKDIRQVKDRERGSFAGAYEVRNDGKKTSVTVAIAGIKDDILARSMYPSLELVTVDWFRKFR